MKRDNAYYLNRMAREHPAAYADYLAGKYPSASAAIIASGLRVPRSRLDELKNAWSKASLNEKRELVRWIKAGTRPSMPAGPIAVDGVLAEWAMEEIRRIAFERNLSSGDLSRELGLKALDASVATALKGGVRLKPTTIEALTKWLNNGARGPVR